MPKIDAKTVAEHREFKEREILEMASKTLSQGKGDSMTIGSLAASVGLTRTALYKYFSSLDEIRWRIVEESFTAWQVAVEEAVRDTSTPLEAVDAYVDATLALANQGAHRIAEQAGRLAPSAERNKRLSNLHRQLRSPLVTALSELEVRDAGVAASLIDAMLGRSIQLISSGDEVERVTRATSELIRRAIGSST